MREQFSATELEVILIGLISFKISIEKDLSIQGVEDGHNVKSFLPDIESALSKITLELVD